MPTTTSALHRQGQAFYQKRDFEAAIEVFGKALNQSGADIIGILDNRAAAHAKLRQFDQGLRDARRMVKESKEDERGYMRCAQILLLEGKSDKALQVYEYGLKSLPSDHPNRKKLEQLRDKLQGNMKLIEDRLMLSRQDPFTILPMEIAIFILQGLSFKQRAAILRVCKSWHRLLTSIRDLWMKIDLLGGRPFVRPKTISSYISRSGAQLTHVIIRNIAKNCELRVLEYLGRCRRLEHLDLSMWVEAKDIFDTFKDFKQLKSLAVGPNTLFTFEYLPRFLERLPLLEQLALGNFKWKDAQVTSWPLPLPNLKSLTLSSTERPPGQHTPLHAFHLPGLISVVDRDNPHPYSNLQELKLDWNPPVHRPVVFPSLASLGVRRVPLGSLLLLPPLRRLELRGASVGEDFLEVLPRSIEHLHIDESSTFFSRDAFPDVEFPNLHTLLLDDCRWISEARLSGFLVTARAPIKTLRLSRCPPNRAVNLASVLADAREGQSPVIESLSELALTHWMEIDDEVICGIVAVLPALKALNVSQTSITGVTIRVLADQREDEGSERAKLDCLVVQGCEGISSDAIAYGRGKGLTVVT